jgi:hypothetical protein
VGDDGVGFEAGEELVEQRHQVGPERLERAVPLPVPVGVGDDGHSSGHGESVRLDLR